MQLDSIEVMFTRQHQLAYRTRYTIDGKKHLQVWLGERVDDAPEDAKQVNYECGFRSWVMEEHVDE